MGRTPWMRIATTVSAMLAVLLIATGWRFLVSRGVFTSVEEKVPGQCRTVSGIGAVADIADAGVNGIYVAAGDGLYLYRKDKAERISGTSKDFHPAALSASGTTLHVLYRQDDRWIISVFTVKLAETTTVYNKGVRPPGTAVKAELETVAVTKLTPPKVEEVGRLTTDELTDPADLVSVDPDRFYLVNRHGTHTGFGHWLDDAFLLPRANILYFDGMKFVTVAERLNSPVGLALSKDGSHLYVAEDYPRTIASFSRNDLVGSLDNPAVLSLSANPQRINVSSDGSLILTAKPKAGAGQVYRVTLENGVPQKAELLYSHKGEEVTSAAQLGSHLLIGTQTKLLDCAR